MKTMGTFLIAVCIGGFFTTLTGCDGTIFFRNQITGSGKIVTAKRALQDFTGVEAAGAIEVIISAQQPYLVEVEADDNVIAHITTKVTDGILEISTDPSYTFSDATVRVHVALPQLTRLDISGASIAKASQVKSDELRVDVSGASKVIAEGASKRLVSDISGASSLSAEKLSAEVVTIETSGASNGHVTATESLTAEASGASTISYSGEPKRFNQETSGASSIKRR